MSRSFKQVVKDIKAAEKCVDKVLEAARLTRNPVNAYEKWNIISDTIIAVVAIASMSGMLALVALLVR